ncbi:spermidine synthase [Sphingomonas sp. SUN039]|uniref:spermidine synthase n=1 Tax=Sphingomonas sp. SUN039 TaxID=2937787 RepID=UPI0021644B62|nr:fused MFS/spermidine synthase [Sphingomonas sp. SUN039]UVO53415.1 fused MFS/spermidine synthase [Sphingomonas sp. SUN039]
MASAAIPTTNASAKWRFTLAILAGSFLLFLVQPMIARMALPRLGGAPAVWNSAMLVYQALLLGGYAYAHFIGRFAPRVQAGVHLFLLAAAALMLPIGLIAAEPSATANPALWTPWFLAASIGPLFFVIAAQAPLLQRWFAISGGGDPYPLYAASNLGSFAGLIAYPLLVEPLLPIAGQSLLWSTGYVLVGVLVAACALLLPRGAAAVEAVPVATAPIPLRRIVHWIALAAVPSGMMLSTTTYLTTDIVAMPLLWVVPLGLYLLSFSVAFADNRRLADGIVQVTLLVVLLGGGVAFAQNPQFPWLFAPLGLVLLFCFAVALHSELFRTRPEPAQLTKFYLIMSFGGVLGGAFCALVAPLAFDWAYEHPILILLGAALLTAPPVFAWGEKLWGGSWRRAFIYGAMVLIASTVPVGLFPGMTVPVPVWIKIAGILVIINFAVLAIGSRLAFTMCLAAMMLALGGWSVLALSIDGGMRVRSYFGIYSFSETATTRTLVHGTTVHGIQSKVAGRENEPLSYYAPESGVGLAMRDLAARKGNGRVGVVGLGAGTLACYKQPGQDWRFYEIDPAIEKIARDPQRFTFLAKCAPDALVEIGDARLVLGREVRGNAAPLDVLVVDAFSSDAVPMHLLTRDALDIYQRRLAPDGILMMHVSNRFLELEPVLAAAQGWGWQLAKRDYAPDAEGRKRAYSDSHWIVLARDPAVFAAFIDRTGASKWVATKRRAGFNGWTDDFASILPVIKWTKH